MIERRKTVVKLLEVIYTLTDMLKKFTTNLTNSISIWAAISMMSDSLQVEYELRGRRFHKKNKLENTYDYLKLEREMMQDFEENERVSRTLSN